MVHNSLYYLCFKRKYTPKFKEHQEKGWNEKLINGDKRWEHFEVPRDPSSKGKRQLPIEFPLTSDIHILHTYWKSSHYLGWVPVCCWSPAANNLKACKWIAFDWKHWLCAYVLSPAMWSNALLLSWRCCRHELKILCTACARHSISLKQLWLLISAHSMLTPAILGRAKNILKYQHTFKLENFKKTPPVSELEPMLESGILV